MATNNNQNALKIFIIMIQPWNLVGLRVRWCYIQTNI